MSWIRIICMSIAVFLMISAITIAFVPVMDDIFENRQLHRSLFCIGAAILCFSAPIKPEQRVQTYIIGAVLLCFSGIWLWMLFGGTGGESPLSTTDDLVNLLG